MKIPYSDIEAAFFFVGSQQPSMCVALLDKATGKIYYHSEMGDSDEIPEEMWELDSVVEIPHPNDCGLGRNLVFDFADSHMPNDVERVYEIFRKKGAYSRFRRLLVSTDLLQEWYDFENESHRNAILKWCKENGIELDD